MSCPRPHGKSLLQLGSGRGVTFLGEAGCFPSLWFHSRRIRMCRKLADTVPPPQMRSGCHLASESVGGEIVALCATQRGHGGLSGFCGRRPSVWTLYSTGC